jgi:DNA polymerase-3 subunit alpha
MVNAEGNIRFGLAAIKGVGANAVDIITEERETNGPYKSIFDFVERINLTAVNRKCMESMVYAGAFDRFKEINRAQYFVPDSKNELFIDALLRYGNKVQIDKLQNPNPIFSDKDDTDEEDVKVKAKVEKKKPKILPAPESNLSDLLKKEKELVGMYLSSHPLDAYRFEMEHFATHTMQDIEDFITWKNTGQIAKKEDGKKEEDTEEAMPVVEEMEEESTEEQKNHERTLSEMETRRVTVAGIVVAERSGKSQKDQIWGNVTMEDYSGTHSFMLFGKDFESVYQYFQKEGNAVLVHCMMQKRWRAKGDTRPDEWEARIKSVQLMDTIKDNIKAITLSLPVAELTPSFAQELVKQVEECKGNTELRIKFIDTQNDISADVFSRSHRIILASNILSFLDKENIKYELA